MNGKGKMLHTIPTWLYPVIGTYLSFVFLCGLLVNVSMLFAILKSKLCVKNTRFVFNVSFYVCNLVQILAVLPMAIVSTFKQSWVFGVGGCTYYGFSACFMSYSMIGLFVAVAFDHYQTSLVKYKRKVSHDKSTIAKIVLACFVHGFVVAVLPIFGWNSYTKEPFGTACSINWQSIDVNNISYSVFLLIEMWFIPVGLICIIYTRICIEIFRSSRRLKRMPFIQRRRRKIIKTSIMLFSSFVVIWTPYAATSLYALFSGTLESIPVVLQILPHMAAKSAVLVHPLVHAIMNDCLKIEIKKYINCCCSRATPATDQLEMELIAVTRNPNRAQKTSSSEEIPFCSASSMIQSNLKQISQNEVTDAIYKSDEQGDNSTRYDIEETRV